MAKVLYLARVHGLPLLDLKLEVVEQSATLTVISSDPYGGNFGYTGGIDFRISCENKEFTVNTGSFSYTTSGEVIATGSGELGSGTLEIYTTCNGAAGDGCFSSSQGDSLPRIDSTKCENIDDELNAGNINVAGFSGSQYASSMLSNTLLLSWANFGDKPPEITGFSGDYIENSMSATVDLGNGDFQEFKVKPKMAKTSSIIATYAKTYSGWTFTDAELLQIYNGCGGGRGEQQIFLELSLKTSSGESTKTYPIKIGGTSWTNNGSWKRTVPYILGLNKPCIMYTNVGGVWKRGRP